MSVPTRAEARKAFALLLAAQAKTLDGTASQVYDYFVKDFGGQSPVMVVTSGGMWPHAFTRRGSEVDYYLQVLVFVLRGETGTSYDEGDADTILDTLAAALVKVVEEHQVTNLWKSVSFEAQSGIEAARIGGWDYWLETHYLQVKVF